MTLVVARRTPRNIRLAADMRVIQASEVRRGFPIAVLKLVIIRPDLCVGFAGSAPGAMDAIRSIAHRPLGHAEVVDALLAMHKDAEGAMDFIVAGADPWSLTRISGRQAELTEATYIGDVTAYDAYQRHYHELPNPTLPPEIEGDRVDDLRIASKMAAAIASLIRGGIASSVGEAPITVLHEAGGFMYADHATLIGGFEEQVVPHGIATAVRFGSATTGGFGYSVLTPTTSRVAAVAIHFFQGRLGLVYMPLISDEPRVYRGVTHDELRAAVLSDFGIEVQGIEIS